ncbi:MAG: hypothetical protein ABI954_07835 [Pyrinomonadaceae bacterium]
MIKKWLTFAVICLLVITTNSSLISGQNRTENNASAIAKIKANVLRRGTGGNHRIKVKMLDGTKIEGYISQAGENSFSLTDSKTKQITSVAYRDVAQVKGSGLSKGAKIGIGVAIAGGIAAVVLAIFFKRYCNEQQC